jgi:hypothetical protein
MTDSVLRPGGNNTTVSQVLTPDAILYSDVSIVLVRHSICGARNTSPSVQCTHGLGHAMHVLHPATPSIQQGLAAKIAMSRHPASRHRGYSHGLLNLPESYHSRGLITCSLGSTQVPSCGCTVPLAE